MPTEADLTYYGALAGLAALVWNVLVFLFAGTWPRLHLAPLGKDAKDRAVIVITNGSKRPLQVVRMVQLFRRNGGLDVLPRASSLGITVEIAAEWIEARWYGRLMFYMAPESTDELKVVLRNNGAAGLIILLSHRFWFLPICIPSFIWVTAARIDQVRRGSAHRFVEGHG